jgi:N-carbamoylputrescine amidase
VSIEVFQTEGVPPSLCRIDTPSRQASRVGLVQQRWHDDASEHCAALSEGVAAAAAAGAEIVALQELTLLPYCALVPDGPSAVGVSPESIDDGPTRTFAADTATEHGVFVIASMYEAHPSVSPLGYNTAIVLAPDGSLVGKTRKQHIPLTAGYYEDRYFVPGDTGHPVYDLGGPQVGVPTCWDEWFPEVARNYALSGADVIVYPTAIGSEPDHPDFDTQPLWQHVIVGNGIANGTFMVVPNRIGTETSGGNGVGVTFYGSSFISDPFGRILVEAPRDRPAVLVADIDLDQRRDWLDLFPFFSTRRPDTYGRLAGP